VALDVAVQIARGVKVLDFGLLRRRPAPSRSSLLTLHRAFVTADGRWYAYGFART